MGIITTRIRRFSPANRVRRCTRLPLGEQVRDSHRAEVAWEPLVDYRRNGVSRPPFMVQWHGPTVTKSSIPGGNVLCYGRSMMKPFMLKAFTEELKIVLGSKSHCRGLPQQYAPSTSLRHNPFSPNSGRSCSRRWMSR